MDVLPLTKAQCDGISSGAARYSIMSNENFIWEVLVRLPTKSLMRFKCVSKLWYVIIRNPKFAKAHGGGFCGLLEYHKNSINFNGRHFRFFYVDLKSPRLTFRQFTIVDPNYSIVTSVINGLIGLYDPNIGEFALCNIATHEFLDLPPSRPPGPDTDVDYYSFFIGFDTVKEVYKVLRVSTCSVDQQVIHVFTLGVGNLDITWRNIALPQLFHMFLGSERDLCINGALYWLPYDKNFQDGSTVFHLNNESFEKIPLPEYYDGLECYGAKLVKIYGSPALIAINKDSDMVDVWTMNNHCIGGEFEAWTRKRVVLPTGLNFNPLYLYYVGTLPTGEMMFCDGTSEGIFVERLTNFTIPIVVYDHNKNQVSSITVEAGQFKWSNNNHHLLDVCYYEENIISLDCLMKNHHIKQ